MFFSILHINIRHIFLGFIFTTLFSFQIINAQNTFVANINNDSNTLLLNSLGGALSAGTSANGDGALIQLGYFTAATISSYFNGTWVPLSGYGNSGLTTVGDSSSGVGLANGRISFNIIFTLSSSLVNVYYPGVDSANYISNSSVPAPSSLPNGSQLLALRIFSSNAGGSYNTVSSSSWLWQTPSVTAPSVSINLVNQSVLVWQDSANPFKTTIAAPEPSAFGMLALVGMGAFLLRRRKLLVPAI